ncbi:MAG: hypothetical protein ABL998_01365 [Planctomycetota bacterium]
MNAFALVLVLAQSQKGEADPLEALAEKTLQSIMLGVGILKEMQTEMRVGPLNYTVLRPLVIEETGGSGAGTEGAYLGFDYTYSRTRMIDRTVDPESLLADTEFYAGMRVNGGTSFDDGGERPFNYHRVVAFCGGVTRTFGSQRVGDTLAVSKQEILNEGRALMDIYGIRSVDELAANSHWQNYVSSVRARVREVNKANEDVLLVNSELYLGSEFNHNLEDSRAFVGVQGGYLLQTELLSNWFTDYLFDSGFALARFAVNGTWDPSFNNWGVNLGIGMEYVMPVNGGLREQVAGNDDAFVRPTLFADLAVLILDAPAMRVEGIISYDEYLEADAPAAVRQAGLDDYSFIEGTLRFNKLWSVSWKSGMLPYDDESETTFSIGLDITGAR